MPLAVIHTRARLGISSPLITVEVHLSSGLPGLSIVGMPETVVKESKDRVRSALINSQFDFPARRITINLAPADLPKDGSRFDLPIAIGILVASEQIPSEAIHQWEFIGELALSGALRNVHGVLPAAIACADRGCQLITAVSNASEAALCDRCEVYGAETLLDVCRHVTGDAPLPVTTVTPSSMVSDIPDIVEVKGQPFAKRALEITAAGGHNLLLHGPPGTGKTMLASRLPGIMPPLSVEQSVEVASIYSLSHQKILPWGVPPFRSPHHSSSSAALVGGGSQPKPGEISLAHEGILFLDELPEFPRQVLEVLREPMESGVINISRANAQVCFPAHFTLVAALNPCPCGFFGNVVPAHHCRCSPDQIRRYRQKVSGPLLDRIDLHVPVSYTPSGDLQTMPKGENSAQIKQRVLAARTRQWQRQQKTNARLSKSEITQFCGLTESEVVQLGRAVDQLGLSARAYDRILKVARTIADLSGTTDIRWEHIAESMSFRNFDQ